jgi:cysteine-rich repeat protein
MRWGLLIIMFWPLASWAQSMCGDGVKQSEEQCDKGRSNSSTTPDTCRADCRLPFCGDGVLDSVETCDDGNTADGDSCPSSCVIKSPNCGNGLVDVGEQCDDGSANSDEYGPCLTLCRLKPKAPTPVKIVCGDGLVEGKEQCDDGNIINGDGCSSKCKAPRCGDKIKDEDEVCDDGNNKNFDYCNFDCSKKTVPTIEDPNATTREPAPEPTAKPRTPRDPSSAMLWSLVCAGFCPFVGASAGEIYTKDWAWVGVSSTLRFLSGFGVGFSLARGNLDATRFWVGMYGTNELSDIIYAPFSAKKYNRLWFGSDLGYTLRVMPAFDLGTGKTLSGASVGIRF